MLCDPDGQLIIIDQFSFYNYDHYNFILHMYALEAGKYDRNIKCSEKMTYHKRDAPQKYVHCSLINEYTYFLNWLIFSLFEIFASLIKLFLLDFIWKDENAIFGFLRNFKLQTLAQFAFSLSNKKKRLCSCIRFLGNGCDLLVGCDIPWNYHLMWWWRWWWWLMCIWFMYTIMPREHGKIITKCIYNISIFIFLFLDICVYYIEYIL